MAFDQSGAAYRYERQLDELLNHQRWVGAWIERQNAHRDVDTIGCEISVIDRGGDADGNVGVAAGEPIEPRRQPFLGETRGRADHKDSLLPCTLNAGHGLANV